MRLEIQKDSSGDFHPALARATSRGLHDTAQPLTVLQGLLEFTLMQAQTVQEYRESVTSALAELSRLTACFENVRQLVRLQHPAADICQFLADRGGSNRRRPIPFRRNRDRSKRRL